MREPCWRRTANDGDIPYGREFFQKNLRQRAREKLCKKEISEATIRTLERDRDRQCRQRMLHSVLVPILRFHRVSSVIRDG